MATGKKQYGLIIPSKKKVSAPARTTKPSIFEEESSGDEEQGTVRGKYGSSIWRENKKNAERLESHGSVTKALADDPSVFEYDSLYDKMQDDKRKADPRLKKKDTRSKYIGQLKKMADKRKLEQELIYERKVQREMEAEGLESENNEAYLTSAYRKKLDERKRMEEELRREEEIENANDVTKQKDLTKFHKHLFNQIASGPSDSNTADVKDRDKQRRKSDNMDDEKVTNTTPLPKDRQRMSSDSREDETHSETRDGHDETHTPDKSEDKLAESKRRLSSHGSERSVGKESGDEDTSESIKPSQESEGMSKEENKEERRKSASAKRTSEEAQMSARERYLARKKMKLAARQ